jgi:prepilin-type N-terminal cleavage/methylation domain-containing protein/prepilin-type processing-associated H-X9-DG protein
MTKRSGFTLIELLVVIAIIAILAEMLFPVFARARESARKIQCLSNVKNIATAIQMYLTDYDSFPPALSGSAFNNVKPLLDVGCETDTCIGAAFHSNPYLRWAVVLDEYVRNREVWNCPSAKLADVFVINFDPGGPDGWAHWMAAHPGHWTWQPCEAHFPTGWGGSITDSALQDSQVSYLDSQGKTSSQGQFGGSIGVVEEDHSGTKVSAVDDPAAFVVCGDSQTNSMRSPLRDVFDVCRFGYGQQGGCATNPGDCPWSVQCGIDPAHFRQFWTDASFRKQYTRHLGGVNMGFADGHAAWYSADAFLNEVPHQDCPGGAWHDGTIQGVGSFDMITACPTW